MTIKYREVPQIEIRQVRTLQCEDCDVVANAQAALPILRDMIQGLEQESFVALFLDVHNHVFKSAEISRGGRGSVEVPMNILYRAASAVGASAIIVAHNHPSGDPTPSRADENMTTALRLAGELMQVPVVDHIIIGEGDRYFSFASGGRLPSKSEPLLTGPRQGPELD